MTAFELLDALDKRCAALETKIAAIESQPTDAAAIAAVDAKVDGVRADLGTPIVTPAA